MMIRFEGFDVTDRTLMPVPVPAEDPGYLVMLYEMARINGGVQPTGARWIRWYWNRSQALGDAVALGILPLSETTEDRLKPAEDGGTYLAGGILDPKVALRYFTPHPLSRWPPI